MGGAVGGARGFRRVWAAQAVSSVGARVAREGLPMAAVLALGAGPEAIGVFAAVTLAAQGLCGLAAGPLVDRLPKIPLLVASDLARAVVLALVPLAALAGRLNFAEVLAAGVLMGAFNLVFDIADHALLPALVARADLVRANARLATTDAVAEVGGPALAGLLFQLLGPAIAVAVNAATYLLSAAVLVGVREPPPPEETHSEAISGRVKILAGFRLVAAHGLVRPLWLSDGIRSFFGRFFSALYIFFALRTLHLSPGLLGLTIAAGGVGGLGGALLAGPLQRRLGMGAVIASCALAGGVLSFLVPAAGGAPLAAMGFLLAAQFAGDAAFTVLEISAVSTRQALIPQRLLGGAAGAFRTTEAFAGVAGALAGGALGAAIGPRAALLMAAAGMTAAALPVLLSPLPRLSRLPQ